MSELVVTERSLGITEWMKMLRAKADTPGGQTSLLFHFENFEIILINRLRYAVITFGYWRFSP